jgi:hypothetical protein
VRSYTNRRFWPWGPLGIVFLPFPDDQFKAIVIKDNGLIGIVDREVMPDVTAGRRDIQGPIGFPDHFLAPEVLDDKGHPSAYREGVTAAMFPETKLNPVPQRAGAIAQAIEFIAIGIAY